MIGVGFSVLALACMAVCAAASSMLIALDAVWQIHRRTWSGFIVRLSFVSLLAAIAVMCGEAALQLAVSAIAP
jgi:hypothetical protein